MGSKESQQNQGSVDHEIVAEGEFFKARRPSDDQFIIEIDGAGSLQLGKDEIDEFINESKQLKMLTVDEEHGEDYEVFRWKAQCHECGHEGKIIENDIGTVLCPKCRSTNVGWDSGFL